MPKGKELIVNVDEDMFGGVYANYFRVSSYGQETVLDFVYIDRTNPDADELQAKVVARINMTTQSLAGFNDMIGGYVNEVLNEAGNAD